MYVFFKNKVNIRQTIVFKNLYFYLNFLHLFGKKQNVQTSFTHLISVCTTGVVCCSDRLFALNATFCYVEFTQPIVGTLKIAITQPFISREFLACQ